MTLSEWLTTEEISASEFARQMDVNKATLSRIINYIQWPRRDLAHRIAEASGGKVSWDEMLWESYK